MDEFFVVVICKNDSIESCNGATTYLFIVYQTVDPEINASTCHRNHSWHHCIFSSSLTDQNPISKPTMNNAPDILPNIRVDDMYGTSSLTQS